jgi:hypothetical protein
MPVSSVKQLAHAERRKERDQTSDVVLGKRR